MFDTSLQVIPYDSEEGITVHGKQLIIYVDGEERTITHKFYDPLQGFIQTEQAFYIPKDKVPHAD